MVAVFAVKLHERIRAIGKTSLDQEIGSCRGEMKIS